ncbi:MAG: hypothetical protein AcusKO_00510 [Acuticoccus sp.]
MHDKSTQQRISVIIPHLNQPAGLTRCLESLAAQVDPGLFEVIVVDNGSDVPPQDICAAFPGVWLKLEPEAGPGPARNRGIAFASGEILAFIDADCVARPDWIAEIRRAFADEARLILGGDVRIEARSGGRCEIEAYESVFAYRMEHYIARQGFTGTGNLAVRRHVFRRVGPFCNIDQAEDRDWGRRASALGLPIDFVPTMVVYHPARETFAELARKWDRHLAHDYAARRKGRAATARWLARAAAVALSPAAHLLEVVRSDRLSTARQRLLAMRCLVRIRAYRAARMVALASANGAAKNAAARWNRVETPTVE